MRVGLLETDETPIWQPHLACRAEYRLKLNVPGLRYMSPRETLAIVSKQLKTLPAELVFMGSGAFHHLALLLIARQATKGPLNVVVFDRHLDCFSAPEGFVSCGSWIREAVKLPSVRRIVVIGVTENTLSLPKVYAFTVQLWRSVFTHARSYFETLLTPGSIYLSIDKDVLSSATTDWGSGELSVGELFAFLRWCVTHRRVVGVDVCGEYVPRDLWPTTEERKLIAHNERINLALCRFFKSPVLAGRVSRP